MAGDAEMGGLWEVQRREGKQEEQWWREEEGRQHQQFFSRFSSSRVSGETQQGFQRQEGQEHGTCTRSALDSIIQVV